MLAPYLNTDSINEFFKEFHKETDPNVHVVMIWDQAGFHTSKKVKIPANVTIVPLPPYSPQLNPIENFGNIFVSITGRIGFMPIMTPCESPQ